MCFLDIHLLPTSCEMSSLGLLLYVLMHFIEGPHTLALKCPRNVLVRIPKHSADSFFTTGWRVICLMKHMWVFRVLFECYTIPGGIWEKKLSEGMLLELQNHFQDNMCSVMAIFPSCQASHNSSLYTWFMAYWPSTDTRKVLSTLVKLSGSSCLD